MPLRARSVAARAPLREEQPGPGLRTASMRHQLDPHLDPWIGLEHFHMTEERRGARPLAGFCLLTYLFEDSRGAMIARDSVGGERRIEPGGLHVLHAGAGASCEIAPASPGVECHGLRMMINLCAEHELGAPRTTDLDAKRVPVIAASGARVRVLSGAAHGERSPVEGIDTPVTILDVHLDPRAVLKHVAPSAHHAWVLAIVGTGFAGPEDREIALPDRSAIAFASDGDAIRLRAGDAGLQAIVAHAAPLKLPVVWRGPFAMSSQERAAEAERRWREAVGAS